MQHQPSRRPVVRGEEAGLQARRRTWVQPIAKLGAERMDPPRRTGKGRSTGVMSTGMGWIWWLVGACVIASPAWAKLVIGSETFLDAPATFGTYPGADTGLSGRIVKATGDVYGCSAIDKPKDMANQTWFAMISRGQCEFGRKVLNAQAAGAAACIVVNDRPGVPISMYTTYINEYSIVAIMIEDVTGQRIRDQMAKSNTTSIRGTIIRDLMLSWQPFFLPCIVIFTVTVCLSVAALWYKHRQRRTAARSTTSPKTLTKKELSKLPIKPFDPSEVGPNGVWTCRICLQELVEGVKIRIFPCKHYFHKDCIDQWLLERSRACPLCTQDVFGGDQTTTTATERTRLLNRRDRVIEDTEANEGNGESVSIDEIPVTNHLEGREREDGDS